MKIKKISIFIIITIFLGEICLPSFGWGGWNKTYPSSSQWGTWSDIPYDSKELSLITQKGANSIRSLLYPQNESSPKIRKSLKSKFGLVGRTLDVLSHPSATELLNNTFLLSNPSDFIPYAEERKSLNERLKSLNTTFLDVKCINSRVGRECYTGNPQTLIIVTTRNPFFGYQGPLTDCVSEEIACPAIALYKAESEGIKTSMCIKKKCLYEEIIEFYPNKTAIGKNNEFEYSVAFKARERFSERLMSEQGVNATYSDVRCIYRRDPKRGVRKECVIGDPWKLVMSLENVSFPTYQQMHATCTAHVITCPVIILFKEEMEGRDTSVCLKKKCQHQEMIELYRNKEEIGQGFQFALNTVRICFLPLKWPRELECRESVVYDNDSIAYFKEGTVKVALSEQHDSLLSQVRTFQKNYVPCPKVFNLQGSACYWDNVPYDYRSYQNVTIFYWPSAKYTSHFSSSISEIATQEILALTHPSHYYCLTDPIQILCQDSQQICHVVFCHLKKKYQNTLKTYSDMLVLITTKVLRSFEKNDSREHVVLKKSLCPEWVQNYISYGRNETTCAERFVRSYEKDRRRGTEIFVSEEKFQERVLFYTHRKG